MTTRQIHHYTLHTGHGRLTDRSEVGDEAIALLRPVVVAAGGELPGGLGLRLAFTRGEQRGGYLYTVGLVDIPLVTCGLAENERAAAEIWGCLIEVAERLHLPRPDRAPPVPWLSVVLLPAMFDPRICPPEIVCMLGDLERCLAWAILELEDPGR